MVARRGDGFRRAPAQHFDISGLIPASRHALVRQVGNAGEESVEARHQLGQRCLAGFQRSAEASHFSQHGTGVLAFALQDADLF